MARQQKSVKTKGGRTRTRKEKEQVQQARSSSKTVEESSRQRMVEFLEKGIPGISGENLETLSRMKTVTGKDQGDSVVMGARAVAGVPPTSTSGAFFSPSVYSSLMDVVTLMNAIDHDTAMEQIMSFRGRKNTDFPWVLATSNRSKTEYVREEQIKNAKPTPVKVQKGHGCNRCGDAGLEVYIVIGDKVRGLDEPQSIKIICANCSGSRYVQ